MNGPTQRPRPPIKLYQAIARALQGSRNTQRALDYVKQYMPSGCGINTGTTLDLDASNDELLVFTLSFHHTDESGAYDGWTEHTVKVTGSLTSQFTLDITGNDRNEITDYLAKVYGYALRQDIFEFPPTTEV